MGKSVVSIVSIVSPYVPVPTKRSRGVEALTGFVKTANKAACAQKPEADGKCSSLEAGQIEKIKSSTCRAK